MNLHKCIQSTTCCLLKQVITWDYKTQTDDRGDPYVSASLYRWQIKTIRSCSLSYLVKEFNRGSDRSGLFEIVKPLEWPFMSSGWSQIEPVHFTEAHWEDTRWRGMITEPVRSVLSNGSINTNHQVVVLQHLKLPRQFVNEQKKMMKENNDYYES